MARHRERPYMSVPSGLDGVDAAFADVCETIRALLAQAVRDELLTRYRVGSLIALARRSPDTYGEHAVDRLAADLGMTAPTLYRYAAVAESWSRRDIEAQSVRTNRLGEPLSWSHLVVLSRMMDASTRRTLLEDCLSKGWSVRKLTQVITTLARADTGGDGAAEESVRIALMEGIQSATRATFELDAFAEAFAMRLEDLEEDADEALVLRAISAFHELHARAESTLGQLRGAARSSEKRLRCAPAVPLESARLPDPFDHADEEDAATDEGARPRVRYRAP